MLMQLVADTKTVVGALKHLKQGAIDGESRPLCTATATGLQQAATQCQHQPQRSHTNAANTFCDMNTAAETVCARDAAAAVRLNEIQDKALHAAAKSGIRAG